MYVQIHYMLWRDVLCTDTAGPTPRMKSKIVNYRKGYTCN